MAPYAPEGQYRLINDLNGLNVLNDWNEFFLFMAHDAWPAGSSRRVPSFDAPTFR